MTTPETLTADEIAQLADKHALHDQAADAFQDADIALVRLQRQLAVKYRLQGADKIDRFGTITRGS